MAYFTKNYKAIISDFDGTLVNDSFSVSPVVKEAIGRIMAKGYLFSIATGRSYQGIIKNICKDLKLKAPQITSGGAEITDPQADKLLWHEYVPPESAERLINYFLDKNLFIVVESNKCFFTPNRITNKGYGLDISFKDIKELSYNSISKITLDDRSFKDFEAEERKLTALYPDLHIIRSGMAGLPVLDITSVKATKHLAVLQLSKILNIDPGFMVGVGDGYNDYPLLSACGLKVAMECAPKELKEIADFVVPDVSKNGLAKLIDKLL